MLPVLQRVWLIDDDSDEHFLLRRVFMRVGVCPDPRSFTAPAQAISTFAQLCTNREPLPELLVVDMNMPGYDGFACLARISELVAEIGQAAPPALLLSSALPHNAQQQASTLPNLLALQEKPLTDANLRFALEKWSWTC